MSTAYDDRLHEVVLSVARSARCEVMRRSSSCRQLRVAKRWLMPLATGARPIRAQYPVVAPQLRPSMRCGANPVSIVALIVAGQCACLAMAILAVEWWFA